MIIEHYMALRYKKRTLRTLCHMSLRSIPKEEPKEATRSTIGIPPGGRAMRE